MLESPLCIYVPSEGTVSIPVCPDSYDLCSERVVTHKWCGRPDDGQNDQNLTIKVKRCNNTSVWKSLLSHSSIKIKCMFHSSKKTARLQIRMLRQSNSGIITQPRQQTVISSALKCVLYQRRFLKAFPWVITLTHHILPVLLRTKAVSANRENIANKLSD